MDMLTRLLIEKLNEIHAMPAGPSLVALIILTLMSLLCWYEIFRRLICRFFRYISYCKFTKQFSLLEKRQYIPPFLQNITESSFQRLSQFAWVSWQKLTHKNDIKAEDRYYLLVNLLQNQLDHERLKLESGLTLLACIGACAPFVGLFGTVWGIYHALQALGSEDTASLEQVAGPVGEALVMTGIGLLVALPSVFAYNAFIRLNRHELAQLDSFAHELTILICHDVSLKYEPAQCNKLFSSSEIDNTENQGELL